MNPPLFEVELANKILSSLLDRGGFDSLWDELDYNVKFEIKDEITEIIRKDVDELLREYEIAIRSR